MMTIPKKEEEYSKKRLETENSTLTDENLNLRRSNGDLTVLHAKVVNEKELVLSTLLKAKEKWEADKNTLQKSNHRLFEENEMLRDKIEEEIIDSNAALSTAVNEINKVKRIHHVKKSQIKAALLKSKNENGSLTSKVCSLIQNQNQLENQKQIPWFESKTDGFIAVCPTRIKILTKMECSPIGLRVAHGVNKDHGYNFWKARIKSTLQHNL